MLKALFLAISALGVLTFGSMSLLAQPAPTGDDLTLHPGDTITFSPLTVHRVRFGGSVTQNNANLSLTSFGDIQKVLNIDPISPPFETVGDFVRAGQGQKVTATVKPDALTSGVPEFLFTCGFNQTHANEMVTVSFKIVAAPAGTPQRQVQITTNNDPPAPNHRWVLKTPGGDKSLTRP
jgi:signal peptidase I